MAQLLGVWNSMPKTDAANLSTANQTAVAQTYASMDKAVNSTSTQTTKTKGGGNILGDILPAVGTAVGAVWGPAGAALGGALGSVAGSLVGGDNAGAVGGMSVGTATSLGGMMETESPWTWKSGVQKKAPLSGGAGWSMFGSANLQGSGLGR